VDTTMSMIITISNFDINSPLKKIIVLSLMSNCNFTSVSLNRA